MPNLYIIHATENIYKIGIANDVSQRLAQLQTGNPYSLTVYASYQFDNAYPVEAALHNKLEDKRMTGEWFHLNETDINEIDQVCRLLNGIINISVTVASANEVEEADETSIQDTITDFDKMIADGWRWQLCGYDKYAGRYYQWVRGSGSSREYVKGGKVTDAMLPDRPGKGNREPR